MIFRNPATFRQFVTSGVSVGVAAGAAIDNSGVGVGAKIGPNTDPIIYQMTHNGAELSATLGAAKVWPDRSLNP